MKALCHPYWFCLEGFIWSRLTGHLHTVPVNLSSRIWLRHLILEPPWVITIVSPGYGLVHVVDVRALGYDGYYAKGLALRLIAFMALFYLNIFWVDWENHEGYTLRVLGVITDQNEASAPLFIVSPIS
jgi:hypothetical protein